MMTIYMLEMLFSVPLYEEVYQCWYSAKTMKNGFRCLRNCWTFRFNQTTLFWNFWDWGSHMTYVTILKMPTLLHCFSRHFVETVFCVLSQNSVFRLNPKWKLAHCRSYKLGSCEEDKFLNSVHKFMKFMTKRFRLQSAIFSAICKQVRWLKLLVFLTFL